MSSKFSEIPYKIYLSEDELPASWYNLRADMPIKPAPLLNPQTCEPATLEELSKVFCKELAKHYARNFNGGSYKGLVGFVLFILTYKAHG